MLTGISYDYTEHTWESPFAGMEHFLGPQLILMAITHSGPWTAYDLRKNVKDQGWMTSQRLLRVGVATRGNQRSERRGQILGRCRAARRSYGDWMQMQTTSQALTLTFSYASSPILRAALRGRCCHVHFIDEETEAQRHISTCSK